MITVIVKKSDGNDSVGSMWHETFLFSEDTPLRDVLDKCECGEDIIMPARSRQHGISPTKQGDSAQ